MRSRWVIVSALLVMCTLALAGAATVTATPSSSTAPAAAQAAAPADPYAAATALTSTPPAERRPCSIYASDCVFNGGPCGPVPNTCHCLYGPDGWICGR